ncbi:MAG: flotillin family protein, partial [Actinomycetota bacterium]|nr:flotillin family protein [Actinomycetota bacterium]
AEAARDRRLLEAEAERANLEATAAGRAYEERELGRARAEATMAIGEAEAAAMTRKAEAYKEYGEAATLELLVSRLPDVARAIAEPIGNVKDITIIDTEGANKLTRTTANTVRQIDSVLESFTGASLSDLVGRYIEKSGNGGARKNGGPAPEEDEGTAKA